MTSLIKSSGNERRKNTRIRKRKNIIKYRKNLSQVFFLVYMQTMNMLLWEQQKLYSAFHDNFHHLTWSKTQEAFRPLSSADGYLIGTRCSLIKQTFQKPTTPKNFLYTHTTPWKCFMLLKGFCRLKNFDSEDLFNNTSKKFFFLCLIIWQNIMLFILEGDFTSRIQMIKQAKSFIYAQASNVKWTNRSKNYTWNVMRKCFGTRKSQQVVVTVVFVLLVLNIWTASVPVA